MEFIYKGASLPPDRELIARVNSAAQRIHDKLTQSGLRAPEMDEYYRTRYYSLHLKTLSSKLMNCTYHVLWSIASLDKPLECITLIDHGGGLGLIGLVAKEAGVGKVIYNDIDPKFLDAAIGIASIVKAESDHYILGDVNDLIEHLEQRAISTDILVSYDVLEHIYDLDMFFTQICNSKAQPKVIFASSGANIFSPRYLRKIFPVQAEREVENYNKRVEKIRECAPELSEAEISVIGKKTRMLLIKEVEDVVTVYRENKSIAIPKKKGANSHDPYQSNTVDPVTGWWAEHLINPYYLVRLLKAGGFQARIEAGYYVNRGAFMNPLIRLLRAPLALPIASYYSVHAKKPLNRIQ